MSEAELLELIAAAASELQRRQAGNDTVQWSEMDRQIARGGDWRRRGGQVR